MRHESEKLNRMVQLGPVVVPRGCTSTALLVVRLLCVLAEGVALGCSSSAQPIFECRPSLEHTLGVASKLAVHLHVVKAYATVCRLYDEAHPDVIEVVVLLLYISCKRTWNDTHSVTILQHYIEVSPTASS